MSELSFDPRVSFSPQVIDTCDKIISNFENNKRYCILNALMQSGKTDTFTLVACELHRKRKITKCIIISGNCEIALRDQLKNREEFHNKYLRYLNNLNSY